MYSSTHVGRTRVGYFAFFSSLKGRGMLELRMSHETRKQLKLHSLGCLKPISNTGSPAPRIFARTAWRKCHLINSSSRTLRGSAGSLQMGSSCLPSAPNKSSSKQITLYPSYKIFISITHVTGKGIRMSCIGVNRNQELVEKLMDGLIEKKSVLYRIYSCIPGRRSVCNPSRVVVLPK
jgi:hypothetical protein